MLSGLGLGRGRWCDFLQHGQLKAVGVDLEVEEAGQGIGRVVGEEVADTLGGGGVFGDHKDKATATGSWKEAGGEVGAERAEDGFDVGVGGAGVQLLFEVPVFFDAGGEGIEVAAVEVFFHLVGAAF